MKYWDSIRKCIDYYFEKYGHLFYPPRDFNDLLNQFKKVEEIDKEDAFPFLHTWKLIENYENRFIMSCRTGGYHMLFYEIFTTKCAGKFLRTVGYDTFWEFPKTIAPKEKEKVEVIETPEVKAEEKDILINEIFIPPDYSKRVVNPNHVNNLAISMKEIGQVDPIVVVPILYVKDIEKKYGVEVKKKYKYILIRGRHRIFAKKLLNNLYIRARVIYNDYEEERFRSFVENTLFGRASVYDQSIEIRRFLNLGKKEIDIAKEMGKPQPYINRIKKYSELENKFREKDYVLTILTEGALEEVYKISLDPDPRQLNFIKEKLIKAYESGVEKVDVYDIHKWCEEYRELIEKKEKEIQRKLYGEEISTIQTQKPIESQQVQQIEKPISIPKQEEVKEKIKEVKRRKKEKTPDEKFEYNFKIISYSHPKRIVSIVKKILDGIPIEEKKKLNINEIFRKCEEALLNSAMKKSDEEIEKLFKSVIEDLLKKGRI